MNNNVTVIVQMDALSLLDCHPFSQCLDLQHLPSLSDWVCVALGLIGECQGRDMATVLAEDIQELNEHLSERLSVWGSFLLVLWSFCILCGNVAKRVSVWAGLQFLQAVKQTRASECESEQRSPTQGECELGCTGESEQTECGSTTTYTDEPVVYFLSVDSEAGESLTQEKPEGLLMPGLPNDVVATHIWSKLFVNPNPSLLFRLRRVSRHWYDFVGGTLEWSALCFVRVDTPGYRAQLQRTQQQRLPLSERLRQEIAAFRFLMSENLVRFERKHYAIPTYISMAECPPDFNVHPYFYEI
jgi:uncharacterized protein YlaN (UPF0358 family)